MRVLPWAGLVAAAWAFGLPASMLPRLAADEKFDANALYEKGVRSCVFLVVPLKEGPAEGTGTLIDAKQRLVLTCFHIVDESDTVAAQFPVRLKDGSLEDKKKKYLERVKDGQAIKGKVLFRDKSRDLALVQLDKLPPDTPALPLDKDSVRVDEVVISIGNWRSIATAFFTMRHTVRAVEVMDLAFGRGDGAFRIKAKMIHLTEPGPVPTSGGPVIDRHGHLVALKDGVPIGIGSSSVSIDVTEVRAFLTENKVELPEPKAEPGPKK